MTNLEYVIETHAYVRFGSILAPCHLLIERSRFVHGVLKPRELEVGFTRRGRLFLPVFHAMSVGVAGPHRFVVRGVFLVFLRGRNGHVGIGTTALFIGDGATRT